MSASPFKLPEPYDSQLTAIAKRRRSTRAKVLGEALEALAQQESKQTFATLAADLIGSVDDAPGDLSTNAKHMSGFGR